MNIIEKLIDERKEILNRFVEIDNLRKRVEDLERELRIYGTKESIIEDIAELDNLLGEQKKYVIFKNSTSETYLSTNENSSDYSEELVEQVEEINQEENE